MLPVTTNPNGKPYNGTLGRGSIGQQTTRQARYNALIAITIVLAVLTVLVDTGRQRGARRLEPSEPGSHAARHDGGDHGSDHPLSHLKSLVLVACHSVYTGLNFDDPEDSSAWALLDYQKETDGQTHSFLEHILLGVEETAKDASALLLFSGGQTRKSAGPRAESMGYWLIAESLGWYGAPDVRDRAFTEEHSRDSLENVVFSLCRFYELTGSYPEKLTIVSYDFKEERFLEAHRAALGWPEDRIRFVGTPALNEEMVAGEERTRVLFEGDPYGCRGELKEKRSARDPWSNGGYSAARCPALEPVLEVCNREELVGPLEAAHLPW